MVHLEELVRTNITKEELLNAIENDGYDFDDGSETWLNNIAFFRIKYNGVNIADLVLIDEEEDGYLFDRIDLLFSIRAKSLSDIIDLKYFYKDGEWFYKKDGDKIGDDIQEVYNHIGYSGCIAHDEDILILIFNDAENDPYIQINDTARFSDIELLIIYRSYCDFYL